MGVSSIKLNYRGEPSLHPEIVSFVSQAADHGFPDIMMNTNGNGGARTRPELFAELVGSGHHRFDVLGRRRGSRKLRQTASRR